MNPEGKVVGFLSLPFSSPPFLSLPLPGNVAS